MAKKISELNKKERELRNTLESLKKDYRKNQISKNDYNSAVKDSKKDLDRINKEKKRLMGNLPPIPAAPSKASPLSEIKEIVSAKVPADSPAKNRSDASEKKESEKEAEPEAKKAKPAKKAKKPAVSEPVPSADESQMRITKALKRISDNTDPAAIKKVFEETQKEFISFLNEVKKNREKIQGLESLFSEVNDIRKKFNTMDFKGMTDEIYRQFERMNSLIKENETRIEELVSSNETRIGNLEKNMTELSASMNNIPAVDGVKRDLEALKQKVEWIERNAKEADITPIMEMVNDVKRKLDSIKIRSPYIIE